jgi:ureidoglycolate dehydrogenase (NAD+)
LGSLEEIEVKYIELDKLKKFCELVLIKEGMRQEDAKICAEVLSVTDAYGTHSHGTKNLHNYIKKFRAKGADIHAEAVIERNKPAFAVIDAKNGLGIIPAYHAMEMACDKARQTGIAITIVKNSNHYGAAGYYANIAAKQGMIGIAVSNVDPNMSVPGSRGKVIGNNPLAYAVPLGNGRSLFLDIAMSNVASLKVVQAKKDGRSIPDTWIVDKDGRPTTDPSQYPEEGAMQPMAAHKGYGMAILVEVLTGVLSGGGMSMAGDIVSWLFSLSEPNNVTQTAIVIDPEQFLDEGVLEQRMQLLASRLQEAPKALGAEKIYIPGEMEWNKYEKAESEGLQLPTDLYDSLNALAEDTGVNLPVFEK